MPPRASATISCVHPPRSPILTRPTADGERRTSPPEVAIPNSGRAASGDLTPRVRTVACEEVPRGQLARARGRFSRSCPGEHAVAEGDRDRAATQPGCAPGRAPGETG